MTQDSAGGRRRPAGTQDLRNAPGPDGPRDPEQDRLAEHRAHDEGGFDGSTDDERISPQSVLPQQDAGHGRQDAGDHGNGTPRDAVEHDAALFGREDIDGFRARWIELQAGFVDEPRSAVQQADRLVAEVMQTLESRLSANKRQLEGRWQREGTAETEDLRQAMRQYRSFIDQLLNV